MFFKRIASLTIFLSIFAILLSCSQKVQTPASSTEKPPTHLGTSVKTTPTLALPTPTQIPIAAKVNGEGILLSIYEAELLQYQAADPVSGSKLSPADQKKMVIDDLVTLQLLAQAASQAGFTIEESALDGRISQLVKDAGGDQAFADWLKKNGYSPDSFRSALKLSVTAAWQREKIAEGVSKTASQVHARQIFVLDANQADQIYQKLQSGADFATLVKQYDPLTSGELGWFPMGYLTQPQVESAAFALKPGEFSPVIHSSIGYHIIQVVEKDANHVLSSQALLLVQHQAVKEWLDNQLKQARIELLLP
jgi:parvulin-like peptidyl-prolyl isomerase